MENINYSNIPLNNRLKLVASFVRKNSFMVDVGTDHGYLPIWLVKNNVVSGAIACDINAMPLQKSKENIEKYGVQNITTVLSDGLKNIDPNGVDDIAIAGMGGELIARIMANSKEFWTEDRLFILQPMSSCEELFAFLKKENFEIVSQDAIIDKNKLYTVLAVVKKMINLEYNQTFEVIGNINANKNDYCKQFVEKQISRLENKKLGLKHNNNVIELEKVDRLISLLK